MTPNGVLRPRPPAKGSPPSRKWQDMQSPAATRYCPRLTWSAPGLASSMRFASSSVGVVAAMGCSAGGGIWLTAIPATPRMAAAVPMMRRRVRGCAKRFMGLCPNQWAGSLQVLGLDGIGRHIGERRHGAGGVVAGVLGKRAGAHREDVGHIPGLQILVDYAVLGVISHDGAAGIVGGLIRHDTPRAGAAAEFDL